MRGEAKLVALLCLGSVMAANAAAQTKDTSSHGSQTTTAAGAELSKAPDSVDVNPVARDEEIRARLQRVLEATTWFVSPRVRVQEGVVFLSGRTQTNDLKKWAGDLARNTQDVVAVVNQIEVAQGSIWDVRPALAGMKTLWRDSIRSLPFFVFGALILLLSLGAGIMTARIVRAALRRRIAGALLRNVLARTAGTLVFLIGTYIVLRVSGLTQLALTIVGSTGLVGLAVGIAFRDITENFLASIFLSMQRPFATGDLVEISGVTGYVQQLNVRTTILMTLAGNVVQIPNATVYKANLRNFTTNANRREDFVVGIGYADSISDAQAIARNVLDQHPAVLEDPEPSVLVDGFGASTIDLRVYFWLNGREHSWLKVRSSVIRLVKVAFQKHGITMPDTAREVIFPRGVQVSIAEGSSEALKSEAPSPNEGESAADPVSSAAEGGLASEAEMIEEQARNMPPLKDDENLLHDTDPWDGRSS